MQCLNRQSIKKSGAIKAEQKTKGNGIGTYNGRSIIFMGDTQKNINSINQVVGKCLDDINNNPKAVFGETSRMKVLSSGYSKNEMSMAMICIAIEEALNQYITIFRYMTTEVVVEGRTHNALVAYLEQFESIKGQVLEIARDYQTYCHNFLAEVEVTDDFIYDKTPALRDFSEEFEADLLKKIGDIKIPKLDFLNTLLNTIDYVKNLVISYFDRSRKMSKEYISALADYKQFSQKKVKEIFDNIHKLDGTYEKNFQKIVSRISDMEKFVVAASALLEKDNSAAFKSAAVNSVLSPLGSVVLNHEKVEKYEVINWEKVEKIANNISEIIRDSFVPTIVSITLPPITISADSDSDVINICKEVAVKWKGLLEHLKGNDTIDTNALDDIKAVVNGMMNTTASDAGVLCKIFADIDNASENLPESVRNILKHQVLNEIKVGGVSITDIYDITNDLITGNVSWGTAADILGVGADIAGGKNPLISTIKTAFKVAPTYLEKYEAGEIDSGIIAAQGITDVVCKSLDKTFHLSDASDVIEIVTGGKVDIGGYLRDAGQEISDSVDAFATSDSYKGWKGYMKDYYEGGLVGTIVDVGSKIIDGGFGIVKDVGKFFRF